MTDPADDLLQQTFANIEPLCARLSELAGELPDRTDAWPAKQFDELAKVGVLGWVIPQEFGGQDVSTEALTLGYLRLTEACLATTFILTQRNGACQRLAGSENEELKARLLPAFCRGELFTTVGISHLTTSRQHLARPAVLAEKTPGGWILEGNIPWVTGAMPADYIITGGTCPDGKQLLVAMPTNSQGVEIQDPPELLALNATQTGSVQLNRVHVREEFLIAGPVEDVMKKGSGGGAGSLTTSALAIGLAAAALKRLASEADKRPDLWDIHEPLAHEWRTLKSDLMSALKGEGADRPQLSMESIRRRANSLALRMTQAYLAATKGAGFLAAHPASRMVREAMFFLVWSCPQPVLTAQLQEFACVLEL
jgi:alkylation response protein AidB-like acyl-CoA dehydrogenase